MQTVNAHHAAIPALGFGVFRMSDAEVERVIPAALEAGFRHFDTAQIYQNEAALGRALQAAGVRSRCAGWCKGVSSHFPRPRSPSAWPRTSRSLISR